MSRAPRSFAAAVALVLLVAVAGCGDDNDTIGETGTTAAAAETTTTAPETTTTAAVAAPAEVDLTAQEYSYTPAGPTTVAAGAVQIRLDNKGAEDHQAVFLRLHDGVDVGQFAAAGTSDPSGKASLALVDGYGGPNDVPTGGSGTASAVLTAGSYVVVCFIPAPDGVPHVAKGMVLPLEVTAGDDDAALEEGDGTIDVKDFAFGPPTDFAGKGTYTVANDGPQPHEIGIVKLADGATLDDAKAFLSSTAPSGPPPFTSAGGISAVSPGVKATVDLALEAGSYVFVCFIPDLDSGAPHVVLGMIQQVDVK